MKRIGDSKWIALTSLVGIAAAVGVTLASPTGGGSVSGTVVYKGKAPDKKKLQVTKDAAICGKKDIYDESLVVGRGGALANTVVFIDGIAGGKAAGAKVVLDQVGCRYAPHVQAAMIGSKLTVKNSDAAMHNVHSYLNGSTVFNFATPTQGSQVEKELEEEGPIAVKCDAGHTWMNAWVYVLEHSYFSVTGQDGKFTIEGVPPGTYQVKTWHEKLGEKSGNVTVEANGTATMSFEYK